MSDEEYYAIKGICQRYGYGNVMALASALWEKELKDENAPIEIAFIPVLRMDVKRLGKELAEKSAVVYRKIIEKKEGKQK